VTPTTQPIPMNGAREWVVMFDEAWRRNTHRTALPGARRCHPDGFVMIISTGDAQTVHAQAAWLFGGECFAPRLVQPDDHRREVHPLGCLGVWDADRQCWYGPAF